MQDSEGYQPAAIQASGLRVSYGERVALADFSVAVPAGGVFGLLGPNGSGKSTFLTLVAAMEAPPVGTVEIFGQSPRPALRARTGVVFQENTSDPLMTVIETLTLAGRMFGVPRNEIAERGRALLGRFGLGERAQDTVGTLSGGMRRRLEMARALLHKPDLLLLDEPTTGVDPGERRALWEALTGADHPPTILLATNDLGEADAVCDRVAFVRSGRVVAEGTPAELKAGLRRDSVRLVLASPELIGLDGLATLPGAGTVTRTDTEILVTVDDAGDFLRALFERAPAAVRSVRVEASSLEDAYFQFVGREMRE
ncbi:MAG TPA: ABC transporter ATP-binding protein [Tepidiformaceae bacterium]|nr:ABC transporter ATP-binding protein [Tepidiformaceae bacterium]